MTQLTLYGKVKFFNEDKGFGFITPSNGGKDVFVHARDLQRSNIDTLQEKENVSFELEEGKDGRTRAVNINLV